MGAILTILLWVVAVLMIVASLLPLSKLPHGFIRGLAFPREQIFLLSLFLLLAMLTTQEGTAAWVGGAIAVSVAVIQLVYIAKFTPLWPRQSVDASPGLQADDDRLISLLAANVKKSNRQYDRLIDLIEARDPDIVMAIEVDEDWIAALKSSLSERYAHWVEVPLDNGYGLCLMSQLALSETQVRELITEGVPSIRTAVRMRQGEDVRLYVVHPEPPVIDHDTKGRDSEIAMVGLEAAKDGLPVIVSGDLNDVAWSTTTRRFQRLSGLLDPRVGRGFYNTFSATMPLMRWPLDHLFHAPRFRLLEMERLGKIGSDHFPMWFVLGLAETEKANTDPGSADPEEAAETKKMIRQEAARDREAIGSDWEDED